MSFPRPKKVYTEAELYEYAVGALGRRMRTVAELKRLLRQRGEADTEFGQTLVELIIRKLKDQGYLNDAVSTQQPLSLPPRQRSSAACAWSPI